MHDNDDTLDQTPDQFGTARPIVNPQPDDDPPPQVSKEMIATLGLDATEALMLAWVYAGRSATWQKQEERNEPD